jgi:hypothetical protein
MGFLGLLVVIVAVVVSSRDDGPPAEVAEADAQHDAAPAAPKDDKPLGGPVVVERLDDRNSGPPRGTPLPPVPDLPNELLETTTIGGPLATARFREFLQDGSYLVGFELSTARVGGNDVISYLRPIFRDQVGAELRGTRYGHPQGKPVTVMAKEGYALATFAVVHGNYLQGIRFHFLKIVPGGLDTDDWIASDWYGDQGLVTSAEETRPPRGSLAPRVVGIHGMRFEDTGENEANRTGSISALGLIVVPVKQAPVTVGPGSPNQPPPRPPRPPGSPPPPDGPILRPLPIGWLTSKTFGTGSTDSPFNEFRTDGSVLIGFQVGADMRYFRPIWLTPEGEDLGTEYGKKPDDQTKLVTLKARDGFSVGGMVVNGGPNEHSPDRLDGISLSYAKRIPKKTSLNLKDTYTSSWAGEMAFPGKGQHALGTLNFPIVGIHGQRDPYTGEITALGFIVPNKPDGWTTAPAPEKLLGGKPERTKLAGDETPNLTPFSDAAPAGGWLVGVEVYVSKWKGFEAIGSVRAMYTIGAKPLDGVRLGTPLDKSKDRVVRVLARPGYAVGAINVKGGAEVSGFSITFMKVKGTRLDSKDSYESEWIGWNVALPKTTLGGDGAPVVGLHGSTKSGEPVRALGLLLDPIGR